MRRDLPMSNVLSVAVIAKPPDIREIAKETYMNVVRCSIGVSMRPYN